MEITREYLEGCLSDAAKQRAQAFADRAAAEARVHLFDGAMQAIEQALAHLQDESSGRGPSSPASPDPGQP